MVSERTLKRWRKEALINGRIKEGIMTPLGLAIAYQESLNRILRMTQELLDLHLIRK